MSTDRETFAAVLLRNRVISAAQLGEARKLCRNCGGSLDDALVKLGYATHEQVVAAWAECLELVIIDLTDVTVPPSIIELVPESVARENVVLPLSLKGRVLTIAMSDPTDIDLIQKLQFILNKEITPVLALGDQIIEAINRHYGQSETESVDSMLVEFTDTAIDFTESEVAQIALGDAGIDYEIALDQSRPAAVKQSGESPLVERRATVRYYHRMNPERMVPLLVVLSRQALQEVARRGVAQGQSQAFQVAGGSVVEIEPILPGCACYPPKEQVRIGAGDVSVTFWVVPHVLGQVMQARVVVRQDGATLAEVPLKVRVVKQTLTLLMGALGLVLPFVLLLLKHFRLDFESQLEDGFSLYAQVAQFLLQWLTPEVLGGLLLAATVALYLWLRPRKRDVFWDIRPVQAEEIAQPAQPARTVDPRAQLQQARAAFERGDVAGGELLLGVLLEARPDYRPALLYLAERHECAGNHAGALELYERVLELGRARASDYFRASLAAYKAGNIPRALAIFRQAEAALPAKEMKGPLWFNAGCFAARLGRFAEALRYLNRAVDAGYDNREIYRCDPDLEPLRWQAGFRRLLRSLVC
jgi:tetratricopeptide (TPR) repeat protein